MKNLVYLLFLFLIIGSSFTFLPINGYTAVVQEAPLSLDIKVEKPLSTTSNDGNLYLHVSGGSAPYTIQVMSTYSPSQVYTKEKIELKKLGVGNYLIMVQDAKKHVVQQSIELTSVQ